MTMLPLDDALSAFRQVHEEAGDAAFAAIDPTEILDAVDVPIVVLQRDLAVVSFNRAAADVLGLRPSDVGRSPRLIAALAGAPNLERWCADVLSCGMPSQHDFRAADRSFVLRINPHLKSNCRTGAAVLTFTNVTAFRASLDQAIYEREYTKAVLNTVADPIVILNADLIVQSANRAFYAMFRMSREATQGLALRALCSAAFDLPRLQAQLNETLADDRKFQPIEVDCDLPDARRRIITVNASQLSLPGHPGPLALVSFQDVTERRRNEERAQRLASIVESSDEVIISKSLDGVITSWNKAAERLFGYLAEEIIGQPVAILIPPDRQQVEEAILERVRRGEGVQVFETVRRRKQGSLMEISLTTSPIKDAQGKVVGVASIVRDITERRRADEHGRLLAREIDHRSKNLLALVHAIVELTQASTAGELKKAIGGRIRALSNAHTLLGQSRWAGADLRSLVAEELLPFGPEGSRADVEGPDLSLEPQLAQSIAMVLHELTTNAVKYGALSVPDGRVRIAWRRAAGKYLVLGWTETGGPPVEPPKRAGFGTRVVDQIVRSQLNGKARFDWRASGLECEIEISADGIVQS
jgi:PAS domain S-box-containing protein